MTKSTITRERLEQLANFKGSPVTRQEEQELARMALAAMDSEPVAWTDEEELRDANESGSGYLFGIERDANKFADPRRQIMLYRHAQPAPVVPDKMNYQDGVLFVLNNDMSSIERGTVAMRAWNACRAAMLQTGNSPVIPDTWIPVSEQMPPSRHEVLVGRWWGEKPRWCCKWATYIPGHPDAQSSGWLIPGASWTPTHWMELPAAPQEVK
ncbi:DUF551 domain-containing protein [Klebsiella aerogenes]|uniref:DUF551 domain-containing protein n=1 Tax=Klebsiella aerogenes TaxID=548 RepID=UPI00063CA383|nr:DUF551 domain-containing protein [Klebsiella aerogenes]KLF74562.1 hypothetical protein YA38_01785 [Klebsiella aerogenes]